MTRKLNSPCPSHDLVLAFQAHLRHRMILLAAMKVLAVKDEVHPRCICFRSYGFLPLICIFFHYLFSTLTGTIYLSATVLLVVLAIRVC